MVTSEDVRLPMVTSEDVSLPMVTSEDERLLKHDDNEVRAAVRLLMGTVEDVRQLMMP